MASVFTAGARQNRPLRPGMGPLVAAGGLCVLHDELRDLERDVEALCRGYGFPDCEEFRLSPVEGAWMYDNLMGQRRWRFLREAIGLAGERKVIAVVVVHDTGLPALSGATDAETDAAISFMSLVEKHIAGRREIRVVTAAGDGGEVTEDWCVGGCLEALADKTSRVKAGEVTVSVSPLRVRRSRLLQLARVVVSCTTAVASGDKRCSGRVFGSVRHLLATERGRVGRVGLTLHPYYMYANLYHWLLGDSYFWMHGTEFALPLACYPYSCGADRFGPNG